MDCSIGALIKECQMSHILHTYYHISKRAGGSIVVGWRCMCRGFGGGAGLRDTLGLSLQQVLA